MEERSGSVTTGCCGVVLKSVNLSVTHRRHVWNSNLPQVIFALRDDVMASLREIWLFVKKQDYSNEGACFYPKLIRSSLVTKTNQWVKVKEKIIQQVLKKKSQTNCKTVSRGQESASPGWRTCAATLPAFCCRLCRSLTEGHRGLQRLLRQSIAAKGRRRRL